MSIRRRYKLIIDDLYAAGSLKKWNCCPVLLCRQHGLNPKNTSAIACRSFYKIYDKFDFHLNIQPLSYEVIAKVVRIQEPGVRIIEKQTGFELEFHSEFWILSSEFPQNASFAIGSYVYKLKSNLNGGRSCTVFLFQCQSQYSRF